MLLSHSLEYTQSVGGSLERVLFAHENLNNQPLHIVRFGHRSASRINVTTSEVTQEL